MNANDSNTLIFAQEVVSNENIRTEEKRSTVNNRPTESVHKVSDGQGVEAGRKGQINDGIFGEVQSGSRGDGVLSKRRESADPRNVLEEYGRINNVYGEFVTILTLIKTKEVQKNEKQKNQSNALFSNYRCFVCCSYIHRITYGAVKRCYSVKIF